MQFLTIFQTVKKSYKSSARPYVTSRDHQKVAIYFLCLRVSTFSKEVVA